MNRFVQACSSRARAFAKQRNVLIHQFVETLSEILLGFRMLSRLIHVIPECSTTEVIRIRVVPPCCHPYLTLPYGHTGHSTDDAEKHRRSVACNRHQISVAELKPATHLCPARSANLMPAESHQKSITCAILIVSM